MSLLPLVYNAGPYTLDDPVRNTHTAMKLWHEMRTEGVVVPFCPHWSMFQQFLEPISYEEWIAYDRNIISRCDALFRIPGLSKGADNEVDYARSLEMPVFRSKTYLYAWARKWSKGDDHL